MSWSQARTRHSYCHRLVSPSFIRGHCLNFWIFLLAYLRLGVEDRSDLHSFVFKCLLSAPMIVSQENWTLEHFDWRERLIVQVSPPNVCNQVRSGQVWNVRFKQRLVILDPVSRWPGRPPPGCENRDQARTSFVCPRPSPSRYLDHTRSLPIIRKITWPRFFVWFK